MSDSPRQSWQGSQAKNIWLLPAVFAGIILGAVLGKLMPDFVAGTAIIGRVFIGAVLVVALPLVISQLVLALNNPRERVRRGINHTKVLVQALVSAVALIALSLVAAAILPSGDTSQSISTVLHRFNPEQFVTFAPDSGLLLALLLSVVAAALLGALGDRAQSAVTFFNRIARASVRTFRLLLLTAPIGFLFVTAALVSGATVVSGSVAGLSSLSPTVSWVAAAGGLALYAAVVLGIDMLVGQLRPQRKERRPFERDRRPTTRRPGAGPQPATVSRGPVRERPPVQRVASDRPRERERSPFDMGVSSTPVLDIDSGVAKPTRERGPVPETSDRHRDDSRPARPPREGQREEQRDEQRDGPREGQRSRSSRGGYRDGQRDRGPRGPRDDRGGRGRSDYRGGFRPDRPDRHQGPERDVPESRSDERTPANGPIDRSSIAAELVRVGEHLGRNANPESSEISRPASPQRVSTPPANERPIQPAPMERPTSPSQVERPAPPAPVERPVVERKETPRIEPAPVLSHTSPEPSEAEVQYGRSRHRKYERPDAEGSSPGVEPPVPEALDKFSTDDMAFGRGKRRKGPR